ncbi:MAG: GNAT family N-acetyltransferase [Treponema sp.]|jgi:predicted N-acetyltransferase YhbS|nr:GNAT family N-acetyltransferase [Treponema sp.]
MNVHYDLAEAGDYEELIDFCNYVFSHANSPTDFPALLPKLYRREYFMQGRHYTAREDGRIRAVVGAYPLRLNVLGTVLPGRGIGMVSVHPYARSRGYMRTLMETALADMRRDGIVFGCLGGQRQRYEYFGFSPAGLRVVFECHRTNIRHVLGKDFPPVFSLRQLSEGDKELEDSYLIHQSKAARFERDRGKFFDILSSWKNRAVALSDENGFAGYLVYRDSGYGDTGTAIQEINLKEPARMIQAIGCFLNHLGRDCVWVDVQPWETEKLEIFSAFAENYRITTAESFTVFDWQPLLSALLQLKTASGQVLPDGEALFRISRGDNAAGSPDSCFRIAVEQGRAQVRSDTGEGAIVLDPLRAVRLFFSAAPWSCPALLNNPFLRGILPLPLFFETPDGI